MPSANHSETPNISRPAVLAKAFGRVVDIWHINQTTAGKLVGYKQSRISQILNGSSSIELDSKEGEAMVLVVRIFRSLDALMGGNEGNQRIWLNAYNDALNGKPLELMQEIVGLVRVSEYLDAMRGKN